MSSKSAACTTAAALVVLGLAVAPASSRAVDVPCPVATELSTLAPGAPLHGLTVSSGTTPEDFTGRVIGIQRDGIVPGVDLVVAQLASPAIDAAGGVWQGMSGSPVHAADGTLVGAVAWGLSYGASDVVGLTPAGEMQAMLDVGSPVAGAARVPGHIALTPRLQRAVVDSTTTDAQAARAGMGPLTLPMAVSGLSPHRIDQLAGDASMNGVRPYSGPSVPSAASDTEIVPGGNLAASIAHGFFSAVAVGTTTEVCGAEVLGFGHPIMDVPQGDLTMHGADVLYVQPDSLGQPYKVANVGGPVGSLPDNLLPGLHGHLGAAPPATLVDSTSTVGTGDPVTGTTYISLRPFVPTYTAYAVVAVEDRALGVNMNSWFGMPGTDLVTWTVEGERADGSTFGYTRTDRYSSFTDIAYTWPFELHDQLNRLLNNETELVTITGVTTTSHTQPAYRRLRITALEVDVDGAWQPVRANRALQVAAGATQRFRLTMRSAVLGTRHQVVSLPVPAEAVGASGYLRITGGEDDYTSAPDGATVDRMLQVFTAAPRNDEILVGLWLDGVRPTRLRVPREATVVGSVGVSLRVLG